MSLDTPIAPLSDMSLGDRITALESEVASMRTTLDGILLQITAISEAITPTIESLKNNPMFKMMGL
ncbi:MAG TPA: hypothetical protein VN039_00015 [Nitrospira sp.]|nr:hypothetical protein [Nitrospira sp.]